MESLQNSVSDDPSGSNPTAKKGSSSGKGARKRQDDLFRTRKNKDFQTSLTASLLRRLNVTDPTTISAIQLQSNVVPTIVPISFRGLPRYITQLWSRMKAIGTRPFATLATDSNLAIFYKCFAHICEAKVAYAQLTTASKPERALPTKLIYYINNFLSFLGQEEECKKKWNGIRDSLRRARQKRKTKLDSRQHQPIDTNLCLSLNS